MKHYSGDSRKYSTEDELSSIITEKLKLKNPYLLVGCDCLPRK